MRARRRAGAGLRRRASRPSSAASAATRTSPGRGRRGADRPRPGAGVHGSDRARLPRGVDRQRPRRSTANRRGWTGIGSTRSARPSPRRSRCTAPRASPTRTSAARSRRASAKVNVNTDLREAYLAATAATIGSVLDGSRLSALHAAQTDAVAEIAGAKLRAFDTGGQPMIRRLDHVAVAVKDTEAALRALP